jgi:hypothetical protein
LNHNIVFQHILIENGQGDFGKLIDQIPADTSSSDNAKAEGNAWGFEIVKLTLHQCFFEYRDETNMGFDLVLDIGDAVFKLGTIDLKTLIGFKSLVIKDSFVSYEVLDIPNVVDPDTSAFSFADIRVSKVDLTNAEFAYIDSTGAILFDARSEKLDAKDLLLDITHATVAVDNGFVKNTDCAVRFLPTVDTLPSDNSYLNWGQYLWRVEGNKMDLEDFRLTVDNQGAPDPGGHFNNEHIDFNQITGTLTNFIVDSDTLIVKLENISGKEKNGLDIIKWNGLLYQKDSAFVIENMFLETAASEYKIDLQTTISPTNFIILEGKNFNLDLEIYSQNMSDINYLYPIEPDRLGLASCFLENGFKLDARISGSMQKLNIRNLNLSYLDSTTLDISGIVAEFLHPDSLIANLDLHKFISTRNDINRTIALELPDAAFSLPKFVAVNGNINSHGGRYDFKGEINSDVGKISNIIAKAKPGGFPGFELSMNAGLKNIDSLADVGLQDAGFALNAKWYGNDLSDANASVDIKFDSIVYLNSFYHDINIKGEISHGIFWANILTADTNLNLKSKIKGEVSGERIKANININIGKADIYHLGLYPSDLGLNSVATCEVDFTSVEDFAFSLDLQSLDLHLPDTVYKMHPVNINLSNNPSLSELTLNSYYYNLEFSCKASFVHFLNSVGHLPAYYLADFETDSIPFVLPEFDLTGMLDFPEAFENIFFPDYPSFKNLTIDGSFNHAEDKLDFDLVITDLCFGDIVSDSFYINIEGTSERLKYLANVPVRLDDLLEGTVNLEGAFRNSQLTSHIRYTDSFSNPYIDLAIQVNSAGESIVLHFIEDSLIFSYDPWKIAADNRVEINPEFVSFQGFHVISGLQEIIMTSSDVEKPQDFNLELKNFSMGSIERLLALDTLVSGIANAGFRIKNLFQSPVIEGNLAIDNMNLYNFNLGRFDLKQFKYSNDGLSFDLTMQGEHEEIVANGVWLTSQTDNPVNLKLDINRLNIDQLDYILADYVRDAKGNLQANLNMKGSLKAPTLNGFLKFKDAGAELIALNNYFTFGEEPITVTENLVQFNNFSFKNKKDQHARIVGSIALSQDGHTFHNLRILTDDMVIMNSTRKENDILFGLLKAKADIEIAGGKNNVKVNANVKIDKETDITYIFPETLALNNNEGTVQFNRFEPIIVPDEDVDESTSFFGMQAFSNFKSHIVLDKGAHFNLYFDNSGENFLNASIDGNINYNMVENNTEVSGMFDIESGTLHYSIPMVTVEKYTIEPGSHITLSNDVFNPYVNIVASSEVRASTEGLMSGTGKVMTFKVLLYMVGELNDVQLRFDISTETNDALVSARLEQLSEDERNINALNLLVRGSFMITLHGDEVGSTTTAEARIDKFYATHLNHLISDNISFVDLKFDVQSFKEYNSSGDQVLQRNYYYNIGKSFLNDRARINYKGSLGVTSDLQAEQVNSHFVQNELEIEMKITQDGRYKGIFFRKNQYEGLLEGEVIETGGGIRFSKDFYSFGDIFTKDKRKARKEED